MDMMRLDRKKLEARLAARKLSLAGLAAAAGVSRQSIYTMLKGRSVLSTPMEKILAALGADVDDLVSRAPGPAALIGRAPAPVRAAIEVLTAYARERGATLFLIGSRARGEGRKAGSDWDFALSFAGGRGPDDFVTLKNRAIDAAFPYPVDVVDLGASPAWFRESIGEDAVALVGEGTIAAAGGGAS